MKRAPHRIPTELQSEILLRLPATSVARFRWACKLWRSITLDPYFIDSHLQRAPKSILIYKRQSDRQRQRITILDSNWAPKPSLMRQILQDLSVPSLITSCNGLLCFHYQEATPRIELFNPATQESLTLPTPAMGYPPYATVHFGFHPASKEYKIINLFVKSKEPMVMACQVYTLGTSSWREISDLDYCPLFLQCSATVKGSIYFPVTRLTENVVPDIVSFDLQHERFTPVPLPNFEVFYQGNKYRICDMVELQGSVCISVFVDPFPESSDVAMDIWMLDDDHGTKHHWTCKYSITNVTYWLTIDPQPLLIHKEKILLQLCAPKENVLSNPDSDSFKQSNVAVLRYHNLKTGEKEVQWEDNDWFFTFVHVESLVPLRDPRSPSREIC